MGCEGGLTTEEPSIQVDKIESVASYKIDSEMAKKVAMGFFTEDSSFIAARKGKPSPKIREIARVSLSDSLDFEAYVVNESEGFVMIAGDSRVMPILAYSSEGELNPEDFEEVNGHDGLFEWHIWTCDGYKRNNYRSYDCDLDGCMEWSFTWYFMNWGWNDKTNPGETKSTNGYYSSGVFIPYGSSKNYNNGLKMITGLR